MRSGARLLPSGPPIQMLPAAVWNLEVKSKRKRYIKKKRTLLMMMIMRCGKTTVCSLAYQ